MARGFLMGLGYKDLTKINDANYGYVAGHLVFAYFTIDPSFVEISIGDYDRS